MPVTVQCPNPDCRKTLSVNESLVGRTGRCPGCGQKFPIQPAAATQSGGAKATTGGQPASSKPDNQPDKVGRFQVRAFLGSGAFGTVYRAYDPQLDREVALKVPRAGVLDSPKRVERFLREARAAAKMRHPHIVPIYDAGQDGDYHYIAAAFVAGQPLSAAIEDKGLDCKRAARIVRQLAEAVGYAHALGIVHRDIKPANVMLDEQDQPLLMDFGLAASAQEAEKLTQDGSVLGTPAYMAPEQARGQRGDAQPGSDQYSLGVLLYELLTGHTPFDGPPAIVLYNAVHTQPPAPRSVRADIPAALEKICLTAMAKKPNHRFPSCQALADDLGRWLDNAVAKPTPQGLTAKLRQRPLMLGGVAVLLAGLLGVFFLATIILRVETKAGIVLLEIDEKDAEVYVDGSKITIGRLGDKNAITVEAKEGKHLLRVTKEGFEAWTDEITFRANEPNRVKISLKPVVVAQNPPKDKKEPPKNDLTPNKEMELKQSDTKPDPKAADPKPPDAKPVVKKSPSVGAAITVVAERKAMAVNGVPMANATDHLVAVDRSGQALWKIENLLWPVDFQLLPGERVLIAEFTGNRVTERDYGGKILWELANLPGYPVNVQRLSNGNTFIAYCDNGFKAGRLLEVDRASKTVASFTVAVNGDSARGTAFIAAHKLADGRIVYVKNGATSFYLDASGKQIGKTPPIPQAGNLPIWDWIGNLDVTPDGVLLAALSDNTVWEWGLKGTKGWNPNMAAKRVTRLANGNTLVMSQTEGVVEFDQKRKQNWQYLPPAGYEALRARQMDPSLPPK